MGDEQQTDSACRQIAQPAANFAERRQVETGGGLIEQEGRGIVDQRAGDQQAAAFTGGELVHPTVGQMFDFKACHGFLRGGFHFLGDVVVPPDADGAEEAGEDQFAAGDVARALGHEVVADDAQVGAEVEDVPVFLAQDSQAGFRLKQRIAFARDRLDERGFSAAVGTEDGDVLAGVYGEAEAI